MVDDNDLGFEASRILALSKWEKVKKSFIKKNQQMGNFKTPSKSICKDSPTGSHILDVTGKEQTEKCRYCNLKRVIGPLTEQTNFFFNRKNNDD